MKKMTRNYSHKRYDVFISFRGEDTRANFTSHLHQALDRENFEVFIDYKLNRGDEVAEALIEAISDSHISVVVLSKDYATSKWCLNELVEILKCRKRDGQIVIPVFYGVDPSDVRKQTGSYGKAFAKYEADIEENETYQQKVSEWRIALTEAANLSGWDSSTFRDESQVIQNIVKDVWKKLSLKFPNELKGLVEIYESREHFESLLNEFSRIGIWGMGGIGKTTIARLVFSEHFPEYDSVCFMEKVSEESDKFGLSFVRNKLLSELLKRQITTSDSLGSSFIQRRLGGRKVFIVLDDVDNVLHLEELCKGLDELGPDSRLIVTTRNKHTVEGKVDEIYEVRGWKFLESLKLFSLAAFEQSHPKKGYERLSEKAVEYAAGVPLALKVLGSHLRSKDIKFWESELTYLENKGESLEDIQKVLRISYSRLQGREQAIFLDIAFFFKGEDKDFVIRILNACDFGATSGIEILEDKALITISNNNIIQMHDLLQKMGLEIVREANTDPGRRSRLRDIEEVKDVLKYNKGTDAVEGITLDLSQRVDLHLQAEAFHMMMNLRFLRLHVPQDKTRSGNICLPTVPNQFSDKLRYLEWNGYPLKYLPRSFCAELLVEIRLPHSNVEELWHGTQELLNLEGIDLSECKHLLKLPDLSKATKLKWLYLSGCESLCDIEPCTFSSGTLVTLMLERCKNLERLVSETHLTSLQEFNVHGCSSLREFSLSSDSIKRLDLRNTGIQILHSSIGNFSNIEWLNLDDLKLKDIPDELSCLTLLKELSISNCNAVTKHKLHVLFNGLQSLRVLTLKDCRNLSELPANIGSLSSLYELKLDGSNVKSLPTSIKNLSWLEILSLENCKKLSSLPDILPQHLKWLVVDNCVSLVSVSSLKTFSERMIGKHRYISFKNGIGLNGASLECVTKDALTILKSAVYHNIIVKYDWESYSYNYNGSTVCLPGSRVPRQFKYRTTSSSITVGPIDFTTDGYLFAVVVSPSHSCGMKKQQGESDGAGAYIRCQCFMSEADHHYKRGSPFTWHDKNMTDLKSDHVYLWYDAFQCAQYYSNNNSYYYSFEFSVSSSTDTGEREESFSVKECGVWPVYFTERPMIAHTLRLGLREFGYKLIPLYKTDTWQLLPGQLHRFSYFKISKPKKHILHKFNLNI